MLWVQLSCLRAVPSAPCKKRKRFAALAVNGAPVKEALCACSPALTLSSAGRALRRRLLGLWTEQALALFVVAQSPQSSGSLPGQLRCLLTCTHARFSTSNFSPHKVASANFASSWAQPCDKRSPFWGTRPCLWLLLCILLDTWTCHTNAPQMIECTFPTRCFQQGFISNLVFKQTRTDANVGLSKLLNPSLQNLENQAGSGKLARKLCWFTLAKPLPAVAFVAIIVRSSLAPTLS